MSKVDALVKSRHPGENRGPEVLQVPNKDWIPAFAGMTKNLKNGVLEEWSDGVLGLNHYSSTPMLHYSKVLSA